MILEIQRPIPINLGRRQHHPALARRGPLDIGPDSVALAWSEIRRFNPAAKKAGFPPKVVAAVLLAVRKFDCHGTVLVADRDRDTDRKAELEEGIDRARKLFANHPIAWGLAVECRGMDPGCA